MSRDEMIGVIIELVCRHYGVTMAELVAQNTHRKFTQPRHVAVCLIKKKLPNITVQELGKVFSRHHSTIIHVLRMAPAYYAEDIKYLWGLLQARTKGF